MKILDRQNCEWVEAHWDAHYNTITTQDGLRIPESQIFAIEDDERDKYVVCASCGEMIPNTKAAIKKHQELMSKSDKCFNCKYLRETNVKTDKKSYTRNEDGTYNYVAKVTSKLLCNVTYSYNDINSENANKNCRYRQCAEKGVKKIESFFAQYPDAFDCLATVDALDSKIWEFNYIPNHNVCMYKAKKKFTLYAKVNSKGIIREFDCVYRGYSNYCVYSKKYDKLFWLDGNRYMDRPYYNISDARINEIKTLISQIYTKEN